MADKHATVIGGGVAGLSAALHLAQFSVQVDVIEKTGFMGGHAIRYTCKATDRCVKCGACMVEDRLRQAVQHPNIHLLTGCRLSDIQQENRFFFKRNRYPAFIDSRKCNDCAICFDQCPNGAIEKGSSSSHKPFFWLNTEKCTHQENNSCRICQEKCPRDAIHFDLQPTVEDCQTDAILIATGFAPYNPEDKPYGYGVFRNVVTNLELESILRGKGRALKPSDNTEPRHIAFIQCVGSRDAKLNHLWCSRVCCGSALRMAGLIKSKQPQAEITVFYIDIQSFGKEFEQFYHEIAADVRFVRSIPGDIFKQEDESLKVTYFDDETHATRQDIFDMVVLSIGLCPSRGADEICAQLQLKRTEDGFLPAGFKTDTTVRQGVFTAGTVTGPMSIAESIASAGSTALAILQYLNTG